MMPSELHHLLEGGGFDRPEGLKHVTGNFPVDEAVMEVLPEKFKLVSAVAFATSDFSITGCLEGVSDDVCNTKYFIKCAAHEEGEMMLAGEYTSLSTIQKVCPGLVPNLLGFGRYRNNPPGLIMYFLVEEFLTIDKAVPDPMKMASQLAKMHREGASPTGKFGFPVTTCDGPLPHPVDWKDTWAAFFAELLRSRVRMDANACGEWQKLELAAEQVITKVVPRLLVPLKWEGRPIEPSLIHGDLWDANVSTLESGEPIIYDAGSYYAHNEMEIGIWRVIYAKNLGDLAYKDAYFRSYPPAEPVEELDDRNRLYSLKCNLNWSATDPGIITRRIAYNDMCYLCEKYAPLEDLDSYDPELDPTVTRHIAVTS